MIRSSKPHDGFEDGTGHSVERVVSVCVCGVEIGVRGEASMECSIGANHDDVFLVAEVGPLILKRHRFVCHIQNENGIHVVRISLTHIFLLSKELPPGLQGCL